MFDITLNVDIKPNKMRLIETFDRFILDPLYTTSKRKLLVRGFVF